MEIQKKEKLLLVDDSKFQRNEQWAVEYQIVAVCREGNMEQLRYAVTSEVVDDVMFAPIEASVAKRRIEEYIKKENELN